MRNLLLVSLLLWLLIGCTTLSERKQSDVLQETLRQYEVALRWGAIRQAQTFAAEEVVDFNPRVGEGLRVTQYEVVQGPTLVSKNKALQTVLIQYVWQTSQTVRELMDQQVWIYDADDEQWSRKSPLPVFK